MAGARSDERPLRAAEAEGRRREREREAAGRTAKFHSRLNRLERDLRALVYRVEQIEKVVVGVARATRVPKSSGRATPRPGTLPRPALTRRKWEIIECYASGMATSQVAHELGIRPHTVSSHMHEVYMALPDVASCVTAVLVECWRNGWLPDR